MTWSVSPAAHTARSDQLLCARVTAFSSTSLFLELFWCEFWISFKFHIPVSKTYRPVNDIFSLLITFSFPFLMSYSSNTLIDMVEILLSREKSALKCVSNQLRTLLFVTKKIIYYCVLSMGSYGTLLKNLRASRAFQVGNLNTAISSFSWQRGLKKKYAHAKMTVGGKFLARRVLHKNPF